MPFNIYNSAPERERQSGNGTSIAPGVVMNNCDLIMQGKLQVRIPSMGLDVWARMVGTGAGTGRGMMDFPRPNDEVLVVFNMEDPRDAFILGGLWGNTNRIPAQIPTDPMTKRTWRSGVAAGVGHQIDLDDALQMITIRATTGQTIMLSTTGIQILGNTNTLINLTAPPAGGPGTIQIVSGDNMINLSPAGVDITSAKTINITGSTINITGGTVSIRGGNVMIN